MNNCERYRHLLVGLLDRELDPKESAEVNEHLMRCPECREEYEKLRETSGKLESIAFEEPSDEVLRRLWRNPFSRLGRISGIILIVAGYAALICYALFEFFTNGKENFWVRVPVAAIVVGFLILLLLVILERVKTYRKDPYREIER
jgi:anti-sigma factor RsiW